MTNRVLGGALMRSSVAATLLALAAIGLSQANDATAAITQFVNIPAEPLGSALTQLARTRDLQIIYHSEVVGDRRTAGAVGAFTPEQELKQLLHGTGLTYRYLNDTTVTILPAASGSGTVPAPDGAAGANKPAAIAPHGKKEGKSDSSGRFRLARAGNPVDPANAAVTSGTGASGNDPLTALKEVIVTAEKRREPLLRVPVPVSVLNPAALAENGQFRLQDYFATVPGVSLAGGAEGGGTQYLTIRGLSTGYYSTPSVAMMIDDVPVGNSSAQDYGSVIVPEVDPDDLQRIEVLRGPQGTLWGADSIGGLVRFVTRDPSTSGFSGYVDTEGVDVPVGSVGYALHAGLNVPLGPSLAIRASVFSRQDPGYIQSLVTGRRNINEAHVDGGFLSALLKISDRLSVEVKALDQVSHGGGESDIDTNAAFQPALGAYQQSGIAGNQSYSSELHLYWITLKARLGALDFESVSGFSSSRMKDLVDFSAYDSVYSVPAGLAYGVTSDYTTRKLTQEFRLSSSLGERVDWLGGLFFTHEDTPGLQNNFAAVPTTGAQVGPSLFTFNTPYRLTEYAAYGDVTVHLTRRLDLQLGGRESENRQAYYNAVTGTLVPAFYDLPSPYDAPPTHAKGNAFTYLVTPKLTLTPDAMLYARLASGYRLGGTNYDLTGAGTCAVPPSYKPDTTRDYELGLKTAFLDRRVTLDTSAYYIDWRNVQIPVYDLCAIYIQNGGSAKSQGLEVSVKAQPIDGMVVSAEGSWNEAELTRDLPPNSSAYGLAGNRLPYSTPFSGSLTLDQDFARMGDATLFAGATLMYVGARTGEFNPAPTPPRFRFPAYTTVNVHTGARYRAWQVNFFVNNAANTRGIIYGEANTYFGNTSGYDAIITQPRTIGLSVSRQF